MDDDARTIILTKLESAWTGTRIGSLEVPALVTAIVGRPVLALVLILARSTVFVQGVTGRTLASITRAGRYAQMRAGRAGTGIVSRAGETVVLQRPSEGTRATVGRVHVDAQVRALVIALKTLIDVSTHAVAVVIVVPPESFWAHRVVAGQAVFEEPCTARADASVTSGGIDALVRAVVLVL